MSEGTHAPVDERLAEVAELRQRVERLERLLADHYHAHSGTPCTAEGEWPNRFKLHVSDVLRRPFDA